MQNGTLKIVPTIENVFDIIIEVHSKGVHAKGKCCGCYELKIRF
jgi:hypothetical protein